MTFITQVSAHKKLYFFICNDYNRASEKKGSLNLLIPVVVVGRHGGIAETTTP